MEDQYVFYRPSQGKKVLVVDRKKNECFFLKWKTFNKDQRKGRELDPRYFDQVEKQKFNASDAKEWQSFLDTGAVTIVPPEQAKKVPTDRIFKRPARIVRTDKNQMEGYLSAKSRMVLPGDVDPDGEKPFEDGGIRIDAPTSSQLAFHVFCSNAVRRQWRIRSFDVSTAFLHGDEQPR